MLARLRDRAAGAGNGAPGAPAPAGGAQFSQSAQSSQSLSQWRQQQPQQSPAQARAQAQEQARAPPRGQVHHAASPSAAPPPVAVGEPASWAEAEAMRKIDDLEAAVSRLQLQLDNDMGLSSAKKWALKKELAMERSKLLREQRQLKQVQNR